jgi:hypothetical protein
MNLYITLEDKTKLRKAFLNLRKQQIIVVNELITDLGYDIETIDDYSSYIVNQKIKKIITMTASGKKMQSIIYVNNRANDETIRSLIHFCQDNTTVDKVILLTERYKNEDLYELFEEVLFFPSVKKVHIIECVPIPIAMIDEKLS